MFSPGNLKAKASNNITHARRVYPLDDKLPAGNAGIDNAKNSKTRVDVCQQ